MLLIPRWVEAKRVDVQVRPGRRVHRRAQDAAQAGPGPHRPADGRRRRGRHRATWSPPACRTRPRSGDRMRGKTCAGLWVRGTGKDGQPRSTYLYHVVDNEWSMAEYGSPGRGLADRGEPDRRAGAHRDRHLDRRRACSARRPSTRCRSWSCWPATTTRPGASGEMRRAGECSRSAEARASDQSRHWVRRRRMSQTRPTASSDQPSQDQRDVAGAVVVGRWSAAPAGSGTSSSRRSGGRCRTRGASPSPRAARARVGFRACSTSVPATVGLDCQVDGHSVAPARRSLGGLRRHSGIRRR